MIQNVHTVSHAHLAIIGVRFAVTQGANAVPRRARGFIPDRTCAAWRWNLGRVEEAVAHCYTDASRITFIQEVIPLSPSEDGTDGQRTGDDDGVPDDVSRHT